MHPNDGRVVSNFVVQALKNEDITLYGDGMQTRSFCYVDDMVDALVKLMDSAAGFTGPVNLGNPVEVSMRALAEKNNRPDQYRAREIALKPLPADDPRQRRPDISLARKELDWQPHTSLDDGLQETIRYFRKLSG